MENYYVVRDTNHPQEDLERNWSSFAGGSCNGEQGGSTAEEAKENFASQIDAEIEGVEEEFKFHPAYKEFVAVHYAGLGAYELASCSIEDALIEAALHGDGLAVTMDKGTGHFFAEDVVRFHKVREGRFIFEIKMKI